jgi:type I restriction-modification system DNA methylase subunit
VEPRVRRGLGEYYTPPWLVEMMLNEFDVKDKIILDPFCGSGTFLVKAFYRKVSKGEDPDKALDEVVGFDINPLAVAVARAELIIAYLRVKGREPETPPHIYHVDTLATWFGEGSISVAGLENLAKKAQAYLQILLNLN